MFTHFFIDRPILSSVISILILLGGAVAMVVSPIEQYPELAPPKINVDARYPGATAEVIGNTVAAPIETQINGVDNLLNYSSVSSSSGNMALDVVFKPGTDPDINQVNVQNRVGQAQPQIPQVVSQQGVTVSKQSSTLMMVLSVYSPDERYDATYIVNYANLYVLEEINAHSGRQPRGGVRAARHRDARVAAARPHGAARDHGAGGRRRDPEPEPDVRHRADRRGARALGRAADLCGDRAGPAHQARGWIEPRNPTTQDDLKALEKSTDADVDSIFFTYQWEANGVVLTDERREVLGRGRFKKGDSITVRVVPDDQEIIGAPKKSDPVAISNSPPTIVSSPPTSTDGTKYLYQVKANDPDNDPITFSLKSGPKGMKIDPKSGLIQWDIQKEDQGTHSIEIEISDNEGAKSYQRYTLAIEVR